MMYVVLCVTSDVTYQTFFSISKILSLRGCGQLWLKVVRFVELKDTGLKVALGYQK